jgi:hypothetical protein
MEAIRKSHLNGSARQKIASVAYSLYKFLALYGESYFLPLVIWTPIVIGISVAWRFLTGQCSVRSVTDTNQILSNLTSILSNLTSVLAKVKVAVATSHATAPKCGPLDPFIDSFAAYFQFPRSSTNPIDTIEPIISIPILGTAFIAVRRKFERIK